MAEPIVRKFVIDTAESEQNLKELNTQIQDTSTSLTQSAESINTVNQSVDGLKNTVSNFTSANESTKSSVSGLKDKLRDLTKEFDQVAAAAPGGGRYQELVDEIAKVKEEIKNASEAINNEGVPAFAGFADNTSGAVDALGSFDLKGFGDQIKSSAENVQNFKFGSIKEGLKSTTQGFSSLGKALIANPLFAIGQVIIYLVQNFETLAEALPGISGLFNAIGDAVGFVKGLVTSFTDAIGLTAVAATEAVDGAISSLEDSKKDLENQQRLAIAEAKKTGKNVEDVKKEFREKDIKANEDLINQIDALEKKGVKLSEKQLEARAKAIAANKETAIKIAEEEADAVQKAREDAAKAEEKRLEDEEKAREAARAKAKERAEKIKANEKEVTDAIKASKEEQYQATLDAENKELRAVEIKYAALREKAGTNKNLLVQLRQQEAAEQIAISDKFFDQRLANDLANEQKLKDAKIAADKAYFDTLNQLQDEQFAAALTEQEKEELAINQKYDKLFELAGANADRQKEVTDQQESELNTIREKYRKIDKANADAKAKEDLERAQALEDAKIQGISDSLGVINGLVGAFAKKDEKSQKKAFKIQKAISIAQATVDTYKGANAIFANAAANPATVLFPAQPFIAAGAAIAAGLANVATIAQQEFQGGTTPAENNETPPNLPGDTGGGSQPAQFNPLAASFLQQRQEQITPRAYVLAGDVASAAEVRENVADLARIG